MKPEIIIPVEICNYRRVLAIALTLLVSSGLIAAAAQLKQKRISDTPVSSTEEARSSAKTAGRPGATPSFMTTARPGSSSMVSPAGPLSFTSAGSVTRALPKRNWLVLLFGGMLVFCLPALLLSWRRSKRERVVTVKHAEEAEANDQASELESVRKKVEQEARAGAERERHVRAEIEELRRAEEEQRRRFEAETQLRAEAEARLEQEQERVIAAEQARLSIEEAAGRQAEEEERRLAELEMVRQQVAEELGRRAEREQQLQAEIEALRQTAEEHRQRIEEAEARKLAEEEAADQAAEEARQRREEEESRRVAAEEARAKEEAEAGRGAEAERQRLEEARVRAEQELQRVEEEGRRQAEAERRRLEALRHKAEEEARRRAEREQQLRGEIEALRQAEEEHWRRVERAKSQRRVTPEVEVKAREKRSRRGVEEVPHQERLPAGMAWVDLGSSQKDLMEILSVSDQRVGVVETVDEGAAKGIEVVHAEKGLAQVDDGLTAVPSLILEGLESEDWRERGAALLALARMGGNDSFRLITKAFDDGSPDVRNAAARALHDLHPDRGASFTRALREGSPERRRRIGAALAGAGLASEAIDNLTRESRERTYDAFSLLFLMSKAGEVQPLMWAIEEHPNIEVRLAVVKLLALSGQHEVVPVFRRLALRESLPSEVRSAVMEAIYQISSQTLKTVSLS